MTPRFIAEVYFCERDEHGRPFTSFGSGETLSDRDLFLRHLYAVGITDPAKQERLYQDRQVERAGHGG